MVHLRNPMRCLAAQVYLEVLAEKFIPPLVVPFDSGVCPFPGGRCADRPCRRHVHNLLFVLPWCVDEVLPVNQSDAAPFRWILTKKTRSSHTSIMGVSCPPRQISWYLLSIPSSSNSTRATRPCRHPAFPRFPAMRLYTTKPNTSCSSFNTLSKSESPAACACSILEHMSLGRLRCQTRISYPA